MSKGGGVKLPPEQLNAHKSETVQDFAVKFSGFEQKWILYKTTYIEPFYHV